MKGKRTSKPRNIFDSFKEDEKRGAKKRGSDKAEGASFDGEKRERRTYGSKEIGGDKPEFKKAGGFKKAGDSDKGEFTKRSGSYSDYKEKRSYKKSDEGDFGGEDKPKGKGGFKKIGETSGDRRSFRSREVNGFKSKPYSEDEKKYDRESKKPYSEDRPFAKKDAGDGETKRRKYGEDKAFGPRKSYASDDKKSFGDKKKSFGDDKPFGRKRDFGGEEKKSFGDDRRKKYGDDKPFGSKREFGSDEKKSFGGEKRKTYGSDKPFARKKDSDDGEKKSYDSRYKLGADKKGYGSRTSHDNEFGTTEDYDKLYEEKTFRSKVKNFEERPRTKKSFASSKANADGLIRLNKYMSNAGICSRREADKLIESGAVTVNGKIVSELGYKVRPDDLVSYGGTPIKKERNVYVLLNKPKDFITTVDDPQNRKTVMELVKSACRERIYPVGRLDRNSTGLLLFTNDGELTTRLTHPSNGVRKVYHVILDKNAKREDLQQMMEGVMLDDGEIKVDAVEYVGDSKKELGVELHSGKYRVVRRIFEHLGYEVVKLDRVGFAGLTKKDLPRGRYRLLTEKEINFLKMV